MSLREVSPGVFYSDSPTVAIGAGDLAFLLRQATLNDKRRARICAHPHDQDAVHEMVICLLDKCYIRPHRHHKSESLHVLEGTCDLVLLDAAGNVSEVLCLSSDLPKAWRYIRLSAGTFHTLLVRSPHLTFHETTRGPFDRAETEFASWGPAEAEPKAVAAYLQHLEDAIMEFTATKRGLR